MDIQQQDKILNVLILVLGLTFAVLLLFGNKDNCDACNLDGRGLSVNEFMSEFKQRCLNTLFSIDLEDRLNNLTLNLSINLSDISSPQYLQPYP